MDDTDKEPVSNLYGHCGAFVFAQIQRPDPSLWDESHKDGYATRAIMGSRDGGGVIFQGKAKGGGSSRFP